MMTAEIYVVETSSLAVTYFSLKIGSCCKARFRDAFANQRRHNDVANLERVISRIRNCFAFINKEFIFKNVDS